MASLNDTIGGNIRRLRRENGWYQKELAAMMPVCHEVVSKWEIGAVAPSAWCLARLAEIFGCSIDALFGRAEK